MGAQAASSNKHLFTWAIVLAFMFGFGFLPPIGAMTPTGMRILGTFIGCIIGWTTLGILETTFFGVIAFGLTIGFSQYVSTSFGTPMIAMMLIFFPICGMLNHYNVLQVLAQKFITTKFCEGHPWRIVFMVMFGAYVCAPINALVVAVLFIEFVHSICVIAEIKTPSRFSSSLLIGVALAIMTGQLTIPVFGTPLVLVAALGAITGISVNLVKYMALLIPLSIILLLVFVLCMRFVLKIDVEPLRKVTIESLGGSTKFNKNQRKSLTVMVLVLAALVIQSILPKSTPLSDFIAGKIGIFGICMIAMGVIIFLKAEDGKPLFNFHECARKGMAWDPFYLAAFIVPFATFMTGDQTGIAQTIAMAMKPLFALPPFMFLILMFLCVNIITNFAQNTVVIITFMPLFLAYGKATGFDMEGFYILLFLLAQMALATPGSSTPCGIVYSATGLVDVKMVLKMSLKIMPILFIILMLLGVPYTFLLF